MMALLEGWWWFGTGKAHRCQQDDLEGLLPICGAVVNPYAGAREDDSPHCLRCEKVRHRYAAHDEAK